MLAKTHRFYGRKSLNAVFHRGVTTHSGFLSMRLLRKPTGEFRVAVVVSKKVSKKAVVRNRIRRRIYVFAREHASKIPHVDMVVTVHDEKLAAISHEETTEAIEQLFRRARVW